MFIGPMFSGIVIAIVEDSNSRKSYRERNRRSRDVVGKEMTWFRVRFQKVIGDDYTSLEYRAAGTQNIAKWGRKRQKLAKHQEEKTAFLILQKY